MNTSLQKSSWDSYEGGYVNKVDEHSTGRHITELVTAHQPEVEPNSSQGRSEFKLELKEEYVPGNQEQYYQNGQGDYYEDGEYFDNQSNEDGEYFDNQSNEDGEYSDEKHRENFVKSMNEYRNRPNNNYYSYHPNDERVTDRMMQIESELGSLKTDLASCLKYNKRMKDKIHSLRLKVKAKRKADKEEMMDKIDINENTLKELLDLRKRVNSSSNNTNNSTNIEKRMNNLEKMLLFSDDKIFSCSKCKNQVKPDKIYFINCCTKSICCEKCSQTFIKKTGLCLLCEKQCECLIHATCITD